MVPCNTRKWVIRFQAVTQLSFATSTFCSGTPGLSRCFQVVYLAMPGSMCLLLLCGRLQTYESVFMQDLVKQHICNLLECKEALCLVHVHFHSSGSPGCLL